MKVAKREEGRRLQLQRPHSAGETLAIDMLMLLLPAGQLRMKLSEHSPPSSSRKTLVLGQSASRVGKEFIGSKTQFQEHICGSSLRCCTLRYEAEVVEFRATALHRVNV